jgi:hypothetical protein
MDRKMLMDTALKNWKLKCKTYKVSDRGGMHAPVKTRAIVFRLDYRLHGRRETVTIGQYGRDGITLAEARKAAQAGRFSAPANQREKRRVSTARSLGEWGNFYFREAKTAIGEMLADALDIECCHVEDNPIVTVGRNYITEDGKNVFPIGIAEAQQVELARAAVGSI